MQHLLILLLGGTALAHPHVYPRVNGTSYTYPTSNTSYPVGTAIAKPGCNSTSVTSISSSASATASFGGDYEFPTERLGPIPTLQPVIPDSVNLHDVNNLTPCKAGAGDSLHYLDQDGAGTYAIATPKWTGPSVVLDHSAAIKRVVVSSGNLVIYFSNTEAFEHALAQWGLAKDIIFVTFTPGCGKFDSAERCYYQSTSITFSRGSLSAVVTGSSKGIHDVSEYVELQWGDYSPGYYAGGGVTVKPSSTYGAVTANPTSTSGAPTSTAKATGVPNCSAPNDAKYGLPTACWGYQFDSTLDNSLGLYDVSHFDFADVVTAITLQGNEVISGNGTLSRRAVPPLFKKILDGAKQGAQATGQAIGGAAKKIAAGTKNAVDKAKKTLDDGINSLKGQLRATYNDFHAAVKDIQGGAQALVDFLKGQPIEIPFDEEPKDLTLPRPKAECEGGDSKAKRAASSKQPARKTKAKKDDKKGKKEKKDACEPKSGAKGVESPWGDKAVLLKSFGNLPKDKNLRPAGSRRQTTVTKGGFLNIYCVSCGVTGSLITKGSIIFSTAGITGGKLEGTIPNLSIGVGIGIYAEYVQRHDLDSNLYDIPLSPFTIGFATIGPILSVGTHFDFGVKMSGNIHARADVKFENAKFTYDFATKKFTNLVFNPKFTPSLTAEGQIELTAGFGVPIGLELALTVGPCAACKGSVGVTTQPTLEINATVAIEAQLKDTTGGKKFEAGIKPIDNCKGISVALSARNYVYGTLRSFSLFKNGKFEIHTSDKLKLTQGCIKIGEQKVTRELPAAPDAQRSLPYRRQLSNSTSNSTETTYDMTEYVISDVDDMAYVEYYNPEVPYQYDGLSDYWIGTVELQESAGSLLFSSCNDGNVYMQTVDTYYDLNFYQTCSTLWAGYDDTIVSTPDGAVLHYYNNTMSAVGVSRLRTAPSDEIPETSIYVALTPFAYSDDATVLAAFDLNDNMFFPVVCTYKNSTQGAKIYLVNEDIEAGIAMLKSPDVAYSITNGAVKDCQMLFLAISARPEDSWFADDSAVEAAYEQTPLIWDFNSTLVDAEGELKEDLFEELKEDDFEEEDIWDEDFWADDWDEDMDVDVLADEAEE